MFRFQNLATIIDVPQESCDLNPQEFCRHQRRLVPHLEPVQECRPQPKEVCTINFSAPKLTSRDSSFSITLSMANL